LYNQNTLVEKWSSMLVLEDMLRRFWK